jgi:hypothetical protein
VLKGLLALAAVQELALQFQLAHSQMHRCPQLKHQRNS